MLFSKSFSQLCLLTATSIVSSVFLTNLSAKAATFSASETFLVIDNFSISPKNTLVESNSNTIAYSKNRFDVAQANATVETIFQADSNEDFLSSYLYSDALGNGSNFFAVGEALSFGVGNFAVEKNQIVSFDFLAKLSLFDEVDSSLNASASAYNEVSFSLFDDRYEVGNFTTIRYVDTNLAEGPDRNFISVESSPNIAINNIWLENFAGNSELAPLYVTGSFAQSFDKATNLSLGVTAISLACVQAPLAKDPCTKVPEPNNTFTLIFGCLGLGLVSKFAMKF